MSGAPNLTSSFSRPAEVVGENRRWSLYAKWVLFGMIAAVLMFVVMSIHDFLAVTNPVGQGILVVEAWIPEQALAESARIFNSRHYSYFVIVGGPIQGMGNNSNHPASYVDLATERLEKLGFDTKKLVRISVPGVSFGRRTLTSATAVERWLSSSEISVCCVDVVTVGVHARKSWILFRHALGDGYRIGIIAGPEVPYDGRFWFFSTEGIWTVVRNLAGYVYAKVWILRIPRASSQQEPGRRVLICRSCGIVRGFMRRTVELS